MTKCHIFVNQKLQCLSHFKNHAQHRREECRRARAASSRLCVGGSNARCLKNREKPMYSQRYTSRPRNAMMPLAHETDCGILRCLISRIPKRPNATAVEPTRTASQHLGRESYLVLVIPLMRRMMCPSLLCHLSFPLALFLLLVSPRLILADEPISIQQDPFSPAVRCPSKCRPGKC